MTDKVKVKVLKHIGRHAPGEVLEVTVDEARHLCRKIPTNFGEGHSEEPDQRAMLLDDAEAFEAEQAIEASGRTVVQTPHDPVFEAKLESLRNRKPAAAKVAEPEAEKPDAELTEASFKEEKDPADAPAPLQNYAGGNKHQKNGKNR